MTLIIHSKVYEDFIKHIVSFEDSNEKIREKLFNYEKDKCFILSSQENVYMIEVILIGKKTVYPRIAYNISQIYFKLDFLFCLSKSGALYEKEVNTKRGISELSSECHSFSKMAIEHGNCYLLNYDKKVYTLKQNYLHNHGRYFSIEMYSNRNGIDFFENEIKAEYNTKKCGRKPKSLSCRKTKIKLCSDGNVSISGDDFYGLKIEDRWSSKNFIGLPLVQLLNYSVFCVVCVNE